MKPHRIVMGVADFQRADHAHRILKNVSSGKFEVALMPRLAPLTCERIAQQNGLPGKVPSLEGAVHAEATLVNSVRCAPGNSAGRASSIDLPI